MRVRIEAGIKLGCALATERMALQELGTELGRFARQASEELGSRLGRNARLFQHIDRIDVRLGFILSGTAQGKQLLSVRADAAGELPDQRADAELSQQCLGYM